MPKGRSPNRTALAKLCLALFFVAVFVCLPYPSAVSKAGAEVGRLLISFPSGERYPRQACGRVENFFFTHVPKAAGTALRTSLFKPQLQRLSNHTGQRLEWCVANPIPIGTIPSYNCLGVTPEVHMNATNFIHTKFGRSCQVFSSHWDTTLLDQVPPEVLQSTLLVTVLRHPVERLYSDFTHLKHVLTRPNRSVEGFLWHYHGFVPQNHMTAMFSGQLGCNRNLAAGGTRPESLSKREMLERAKRTLDTYCVVMVQERMDESICLFNHALFGPAAGELVGEQAELQSVNRRHDAEKDGELWQIPRNSSLYGQLAELNDLDLQLYDYAVQRLERELDANSRCRSVG